jgi:hypothetical protein
MTKYVTACLGAGLLLFVSGCAICASPYDGHFAAYGGSWMRDDPSDGRVASLIHPAGPTVVPMVDPESKGWTPGSTAPSSRSILSPSRRDQDYLNDDAPPDLDLLLPE